MKLINTKAIITVAKDLSPTARELTLVPEVPFDFLPGMFVNIFMKHNDETFRRAYSISSDPNQKDSFTISARLMRDGKMSPLFWHEDIVGKEVTVMGPMGFNTIEKIDKEKVYLFAFGIGAGVIKSIAHELERKNNIKEIYIVTGNKNESEIIYKDFFEELSKNKKIKIRHVLSKPHDTGYKNIGYIQDFIHDFNFNDSSAYICGSTKACEGLKEKIESMKPENFNSIIEAFG